jgi:hypothetical protein
MRIPSGSFSPFPRSSLRRLPAASPRHPSELSSPGRHAFLCGQESCPLASLTDFANFPLVTLPCYHLLCPIRQRSLGGDAAIRESSSSPRRRREPQPWSSPAHAWPAPVALTRQSSRMRSHGPGLTVTSCLPAVPPCDHPKPSFWNFSSSSYLALPRCPSLSLSRVPYLRLHFSVPAQPVGRAGLFSASPYPQNTKNTFFSLLFALARCVGFCRVAGSYTRRACIG